MKVTKQFVSVLFHYFNAFDKNHQPLSMKMDGLYLVSCVKSIVSFSREAMFIISVILVHTISKMIRFKNI